jgi:hypothetical protein
LAGLRSTPATDEYKLDRTAEASPQPSVFRY